MAYNFFEDKIGVLVVINRVTYKKEISRGLNNPPIKQDANLQCKQYILTSSRLTRASQERGFWPTMSGIELRGLATLPKTRIYFLPPRQQHDAELPFKNRI